MNTAAFSESEMSSLPQSRRDPFKIFVKFLYFISLSIYVYCLIDGLDYYRVYDYKTRPHHADYHELRSAGFRGQGFGILGSLMMMFMLLYSMRKRVKMFRNWGSLNRWLDIHIYFGVMGPLFIILHTAFKVEGLIAVSFWSMIAVATSGFVGRHLYRQIPRNRRGDELSVQQIMALDERFSHKLQQTLQIHPEAVPRLDKVIDYFTGKQRGMLLTVLRTVMYMLLRPLDIYRLKEICAKQLHLKEPYLHRTVQFAWQKITLRRRVILLNQVRRLFHYWHIFHKPFAIVMYVIMFLHIGIAVWLGYTWIF